MPPKKCQPLATPSAPRGFEEARTDFQFDTGNDSASPDAVRFAETVSLTRMFALIEDPEEREQVVALARRLSAARTP